MQYIDLFDLQQTRAGRRGLNASLAGDQGMKEAEQPVLVAGRPWGLYYACVHLKTAI